MKTAADLAAVAQAANADSRSLAGVLRMAERLASKGLRSLMRPTLPAAVVGELRRLGFRVTENYSSEYVGDCTRIEW